MLLDRSADSVFELEGSTDATAKGEDVSGSAGSKVSHVVQCLRVNRGEPVVSTSPGRETYKWYARQPKKGRTANELQAVG